MLKDLFPANKHVLSLVELQPMLKVVAPANAVPVTQNLFPELLTLYTGNSLAFTGIANMSLTAPSAAPVPVKQDVEAVALFPAAVAAAAWVAGPLLTAVAIAAPVSALLSIA